MTQEAIRSAIRNAALSLTPAQAEELIQLVQDLARNGCSFWSSRMYKHARCRDDTGKDFDCSSCRAMDLLKELGLPDERS